MLFRTRLLLGIIFCSALFISCEPEAIPEENVINNFSKDIDPVGDSGNEQNDDDHRGED